MGTSTSLKGMVMDMTQTNDEIINKHPAKCKEEKGWSMLCVRDCMNEARLAALDDCKTLLDDRLKEGLWDEIRGLAKARELILAELEALKTSLGKEVL